MVRDFLLLSPRSTLSLPTSILIHPFSLIPLSKNTTPGQSSPHKIMPTLGSYKEFQEQYNTILHKIIIIIFPLSNHHYQEINVQAFPKSCCSITNSYINIYHNFFQWLIYNQNFYLNYASNHI